MKYLIALFFVLVLCGNITQFCFGEDVKESSDNKENSHASETNKQNRVSPHLYAPYCGVHAVYIAAKHFGKEVELEEVIRPQYIGSRRGSSIDDLQSLCKNLDLRARLFTKLTVSSLSGVSGFAILHASPVLGSNEYNHWVLLTDITNGNANINEVIDGKIVLKTITLEELAVIWDGVALVIFKDANSENFSIFYIWSERIVFLILLVFVVVLLARFKMPNRLRAMSRGIVPKIFFETIAILVIGLLIFGIYALFFGTYGFLSHKGAISKIEQDNYLTFLPKVSTQHVKKLLTDNKTSIIDARLPSSFQAGHIDGSINCPASISQAATNRLLQSIPNDNKIIVVYEPYACAGAVDVFRRVHESGHRNLYRYEWGWKNWNEEKTKNVK